jgi:hypothetical protein
LESSDRGGKRGIGRSGPKDVGVDSTTVDNGASRCTGTSGTGGDSFLGVVSKMGFIPRTAVLERAVSIVDLKGGISGLVDKGLHNKLAIKTK